MTTMHPGQPVRIGDPGDLIAAIPAMLGFRPAHSLVLVCLDGGDGPARVRAVMRHDLPDCAVGPLDREAIERMSLVCAREDIGSVIAVIIDERRVTGVHRAVVGELELYLSARGVVLVGALVVPEIVAGRPWRGLCGDPRRGRLPDPAASGVALAQVLGGRAIRSSREELEAVVAPRPESERARVAELLRGRPTGRSRPRDALRLVLTRIAELASGQAPHLDDLADLARALSDPRVRDALLSLAVTAEADAAEQLWILLARALPDPERAEPAALLGYSAYARGDGPMAGVALVAALEANPRHRLAGMLDAALQSGMRPETISGLAVTGFEEAARIGVQMPPPIDGG
ncbi:MULTISPECIES: DUF4192 domain-containing protein [Rhodococcus]|uniref:DUF4192 domain-containing protein n=1 Tax=Rhodococcus TaxID=1827 RepID=UPI000BE41EEC|nr:MULTISPECIES: DUF4192 domain-containing protein [Rhodococcus]MBP1158406.1 hypothetical protein [Rhodococcus sp. PvR099]MCZ4554034.1 DUF4192 domain-containing protein [Rhodococcus maanshanensis]